MTRDETIQILMMIQAAYPNYKPQDKTVTVNIWNKMLEEYNYDTVECALRAYISTDENGYAPSIGQIISKIHSIAEPQYDNESEAWGLVSKAIRNSSYHCVEEYNKLPPIVQKAVGTPEQLRIWAMDTEYNEQVVSSNFRRTYRNEIARQKEINMMPKDIRNLISNAISGDRVKAINLN